LVSTLATAQRGYGTWLGETLELSGGWAGDLAWNEGGLWLAWATCVDAEAELLAAFDSNWALRPGVTLEDWRGRIVQSEFTISLARLDDGPTDTRELGRSLHTLDGPAIATLAGQPEPVVLWAERRGRGCILLASPGGGAVETLTESAGAVLNPRAAVDPGGTTHAVWQQWPGRDRGATVPRIMGAARGPGARGVWGAPAAISQPGHSAWAPTIASGPDGALWCTWDAWDGLAYQVYARHAPAGGAWGSAVQVSGPDAKGYLHFASDVAASVGMAWVVWSRSLPWGQINHRFNHNRSLHARVLTVANDGSLLVTPPPGRDVHGEPGGLPVVSIPFLWAQEPEAINPQAPRVRLAPDGNPVVFFRQFRQQTGNRDFGWVTSAVRHTGEDWSAPMRLTDHRGFPDSAYGVVPSGRSDSSWVVAAHAGESPIDPPGNNPVFGHRLVVEGVTLQEEAAAEQVGVHVSIPTSSTLAVRKLVPEVSVRELSVGEQTYDLLYGDLHRHSAYSKCMSAVDGDPLDHWRWAHDVEELDFYAITEHLENQSYVEWRRVEDLEDALADNGRVITLGGFELGLDPGHTNFFYVDQSISQDLRVACLSTIGQSLRELWPRLDDWIPEGKVVAIRHYHTGTHGGDDVFETYSPKYERVVEIIQTRMEAPAWVQSLWRKGFRVGVVGASDHSRNAPFPKALTGLWMPHGDRTREGVLAALQSRRTFATNGPKMSVLLTAAGSRGGAPLVMGEEGALDGSPRLTAEVSGTRELDRVEFYRNESPIHVEAIGAARATVEYVDGDAPPGEHIYWVRVTQPAEREGLRPSWGVAYSSPVWATV
jgi:hypothetical protein